MMRMRRRRLVGAAVERQSSSGPLAPSATIKQQKYANQDAAAQDQQDAAYQQGHG